MEPSGRNPWQPVANGTHSKTAQTGHGKEGVDGSSPSEGSFKTTKPLQIVASLLPCPTTESTSLERRAVPSARIACGEGNGLNPGVWRVRIGREEDRRMLGTGFGDTLMT
jgi:hypothetical protein